MQYGSQARDAQSLRGAWIFAILCNGTRISSCHGSRETALKEYTCSMNGSLEKYMLSGRNKDGAKYAIQMGILYTWRKARRG